MCYHWSMRNLRKIFDSLGFFKRSPVLSIKDMAARINSGDQTAEDLVLFNRIIDAVVAIAEGDEDKASKTKPAASGTPINNVSDEGRGLTTEG